MGETGVGVIGDVNGDGTVDILDLVLVGRYFGESYTQGTPLKNVGK